MEQKNVIVKATEETIKEKEVSRKAISELLKSLGISPKNKGYGLLVEAIILVIDNREYIDVGITKWLYPRLAKSWGKPWTTERNIRHAIAAAEESWETNEEEYKEIRYKVFHTMRTHFTNKEFISYIVDYFSCGQE